MSSHPRSVCVGLKMTQNTIHENATVIYRDCQQKLKNKLVLSATEEYVKMAIAIIVINTVLSVFGTFVNLLVVAAYVTNRRLHTPSNLLFVFLAVSDVMVTACVQPVFIYGKLNEILKYGDLCAPMVIASIGSYTCCGLSLNVIVVLSVDRFITLVYPYHYHLIVSLPRLKSAIAVSWFIACAISSLFFSALISINVFKLIVTVYVSLSVAIVISAWAWIHRLICRHRGEIERYQTTSNEALKNMNYEKMLGSTKTSYIIITILLFCYAPTLLDNLWSSLEGQHVQYPTTPWSVTVLYGNATLNPVLLLWRRTMFRESAKKLLLIKKRNSIHV